MYLLLKKKKKFLYEEYNKLYFANISVLWLEDLQKSVTKSLQTEPSLVHSVFYEISNLRGTRGKKMWNCHKVVKQTPLFQGL